MKIGFRKLKISHQLYILISFSICVIMLVNAVFYARLSYTMIEQVKIYAEDTVNQLEFNICGMIEDVKTSGFSIAYNKYVQEHLITDNMLKKLETKDYIMDVMGYIASKSEHIHSLLLIDTKGIMTMLKADENTIYYIKILEKDYNFEKNDFVTPMFTNFMTRQDSTGTRNFFAYLVPIYYSGEKPEYRGWIGTVVVLCTTNKLDTLIEQLKISKNTKVNLIEQNSKIVISNNNNLENSETKDKSEKYEEIKEPKKYIYTIRNIEDINCTIECKIPISEVRNDMLFFKNSFLLTAVIMVILLILIGAVINISITSPVVKIVNAIKEIGEKNLKQRINLNLGGDIGFITQNINIMLDKVEGMAKRVFTTQDKLYQVELLKKQAELSALQNQINPHFLYNTLECMRSIGIAYDIDEIVEISTSMADIFRYSIKSDDIVSVKDEIETIRKYFKIITIRFQGRISMIVDINDEILDCKIPKMVLQPIVENAVYHGLERKDGRGTLSVYGKIDNAEIIFIVQDDGIGIQSYELERLNSIIKECNDSENLFKDKRSIGLANINSRIKLIFGEGYGLKIESLPDVGTKVIVTFPYCTSKNGKIPALKYSDSEYEDNSIEEFLP
jgi:two-component system sensor histidine kinase YesM